jgi:hypothetical protein
VQASSLRLRGADFAAQFVADEAQLKPREWPVSGLNLSLERRREIAWTTGLFRCQMGLFA